MSEESTTEWNLVIKVKLILTIRPFFDMFKVLFCIFEFKYLRLVNGVFSSLPGFPNHCVII